MTPVGRAGRWRPGIAIKISAAFHAALLIALIARPAWWAECLGLVAANHLLLGLIGMWPRSQSLGENMLRLPEPAVQRQEIALTFDDGPDPRVTPEVLDLLDRHQATASFFVVGEKALAHSELIREILRRGHSVENHSHRHSMFFGFFGGKTLSWEIGTAQSTIAAIGGYSPTFFRSPMGIRSPLLSPVLARHGLRYVTWTRRGFDTVATRPDKVLARLMRGLAAGDILLLHDRRCGRREPMVLAVLPALLENMAAQGLRGVSLPMALAEAAFDPVHAATRREVA